MRLLDLTLPTAEENIALDEALLDEAEAAGHPLETLRLWEAPSPIVVVGRSSRVDIEVNLAAARQTHTPVLRRCSGGAAIVAGPHCLMYAVVLSYERYPHLQMIDEAHRHVLGHIREGLATIGIAADMSGTSDLTLAGRKFSGNSLRCKRTHLLYHGTLLCRGYREAMVGELLGTPPRQPDYREGRTHGEFITVLPTTAESVRPAIVRGWPVEGTRDAWPIERTRDLVASRYSHAAWNFDAA